MKFDPVYFRCLCGVKFGMSDHVIDNEFITINLIHILCLAA
jgi:hypothetical protein